MAAIVLWRSTHRVAWGQAPAAENGLTKEQWLDVVFPKEPKAVDRPLVVSRFLERVFVLKEPIGWRPNADQEKFAPVEVPTGFVTDFASVPRIFWSLLPTDGQYAYASVIHDYLYWTQTRPRKEADDILRFAMEDLHVDPVTIAAVYSGVRVGGQSSWDENRKKKSQGEKRVLKRGPDYATTRWEDWKRMPEMFSD